MIYVKKGIIYITKGDAGNLPRFDITDNSEDEPQTYELKPGEFLTLTVRPIPDKSAPIICQIQSVNGIFYFRPEDTMHMEPGRYSADVELIRQDGMPYTCWPKLYGKHTYIPENFKNFIIMPEVT